MKKYNAKARKFYNAVFIAAFLLIGGAVKAQTVNITINVLPPYSPYYSDYTSAYASKTLLILQNLSGTQQKVRLTGKLQGDNGILISTRASYRPVQPIVLNPHETKQLNGTTLQSVFDLNSVNVYGIDKAKLAVSSRIPEGHYTLCIEAYDYAGTRLLSANAPMGCSLITITNPEAPVLIGPARDEHLRATPANTAFFNWINPGTVPIGTQYKLEIAEMPDISKDPNQVLNAVSLPVLTTIVTGTSYQYNMRNVPFKPGKRYAWRVTAMDPNNRVVFRNNGRSPASSFLYEPEESQAGNLQPANNGNNLVLIHHDYQISGKLTYQYHLANDKQMPYSKTARRDSAVPLKVVKVELVYGLCYIPLNIHAEQVQQYDQQSPQSKQPTGLKADGNTPAIPDKGVKADFSKPSQPLIQDQPKNQAQQYIGSNVNPETKNNSKFNKNMINGKAIGFMPVIDSVDQTGNLLLPATDYGPQNVVATAKTDSNGHYEFDFDSNKPCKIIQVFPQQKVAMVMCYYINVINKQYSDPNSFIYAKPPVDKDETTKVEAGTQNVFANNYRLAVMVNRNSEGGTNTGKAKNASVEGIPDDTVQVYVLRKLPHAASLPSDEVDNVGHTPFQPVYSGASSSFSSNNYEVVAHRQAAMVHGMAIILPTYNANCVFDNLLDNLKASDSYYIYAEYKHTKVYFDPVELSLPPVNDDDYLPYAKPTVRYKYLELKPSYISLTVKGVLKYRFKNGSLNPLPNTAVVLESIPFGPDANGKVQYYEDKAKMYSAVLTDANGYFELSPGVLQYDQYDAYNLNNGLGFQQFIKVYSPYYGSLDTAYSFQAGNTYNLGEVVAQVKDFNLTVTVKGFNSNTQLVDKLKGQRVYLCRQPGFDYGQSGVPQDEGQQSTLEQKTIQDYNGNNYKVIEYGVTDADGKVSFSRLVSNDVNNGNDKYYIYSESEILTEDNYSTVSAQPVDPHVAIFTSNGHYFDEPVLNSLVTQKNISVGITVTTLPQPAYIDGAVYPQSNASTNAMSGVIVWLFDVKVNKKDPKSYKADFFKNLFKTSDPLAVLNYMVEKMPESPVQLQALQLTGDNGLFRFDDPEGNDYTGWKLLVFSKDGFITGSAIVNGGIPMGPGRKENVKGLLWPPRLMQADVIDQDTKKPVKARIVVGDNFSWAQTQTLYAFQGAQTPSEERAQMQTTYGQVKFTVIPDDHVNYQTQTFTRTIDAPENIGLFSAGAIDQSYSIMPPFEVTRPVNHLSVCVHNALTKKAIPADVYITQLPPDETPGGYGIKAGECASFTFQSNATKYGVKVVSTGYITQETTVVAANSPDASTSLDIKLDPGFAIIGTVKVDGVPKANMGVYIKEMGQTVQEVYTDQNGKYSIEGLPKDGSYVTVVATNPKGPGATKQVKLASYVLKNILINSADVSFSLTSNAAIDFSSIYGFPLEVESWIKNPKNSNYIVTGRVKIAPNKNIVMGNYYNNFLTLKNVEVKAIERADKNATDQYGKPKPPYIIVGAQGGITLAENTTDLTMFKYYHATASGLNGLLLQPMPNDPARGAVSAQAQITSDAFAKGVTWKGLQSVIPFVANNNAVPQYQNQKDLQPSDQQQKQFDQNKNNAADQVKINGGNGNNGNNMQMGAGGIGGYQQLQVYTPGAPDVFDYGYNFNPGNLFNVFVSSPSDDNVYTYRVSDLNGKPFKYKLNNVYDVDASTGSFLNYTGLHLMSTVHTNIPNINNPDINLNVGELIFDYKSMVQVFSKADLSIGFDNWKAQGKWTLDQGTIKVTGNLFAGSITVPVSQLEIGYDNIGYGYMSIDKIGIAGVYNMVLGSNVVTSFGYDKAAKYGSLKNPQYGAWSLSMVSNTKDPITVITGLQDLDPTDQIRIKDIALYSKGDESRIDLMEDQQAVTLNGFAAFTPFQVDNGSNYLSFDGTLDLKIPALTGLSDKIYNLSYKSDGTTLVHQQAALPALNLVTNGVRVAFDNTGQTFANNQLILSGHLQDKAPASPYNFKVKLFKSNAQSHKITVTGDKSNVITMGGSQQLSAIQGEMDGDAASWQNFTFQGDVIGTEGMRDSTAVESAQKTRMGFIVQGDLVANSSQIGVKNLSFGDMSNGNFTYDFDKKAIVGSFHLDEITPNASFHTDFELQLGSGQWYVLGVAKIDHITGSPVPVNSANGAVWIGASDITPGIMSIIQSQFHDGILPDGFTMKKQLKGALLVTAVDMNIPIIPDINLDLGPIASVKVEKGIYANIFTTIDFGGNGINIDGGIKVGAYVKIHAAASILVGCAGLNLGAEVNSTVTQHVGLPPFKEFGFDPVDLLRRSDLGMSASAHVILSGSAYVGFGVCDDDCNSIKVLGVKIPPGCHSTGIGKSMDLGFGVDVKKPPGTLTPTGAGAWLSIFDHKYPVDITIPGLD